jgi:cytidylate kinase
VAGQNGVVTISAAFGCGGSVVGPAVAERLGLTFVDRAIPAAVAQQLGVDLETALAHDDVHDSGLGALLAGAARLPNLALGGIDAFMPSETDLLRPETFVAETERVLEALAERGAVLLGRAAAQVLGDRPGTLHVRLTGPVPARVAQASRLGDVSEKEAEEAQAENDRARTAYVKHFYGVDPDDCATYHLVIDSTALPLETVTEIVVAAALARVGPSADVEGQGGTP